MQISGDKTKNFLTHEKSVQSPQDFFGTPGLSLRGAQEPGISPGATKKVAPHYFHRKIEEK